MDNSLRVIVADDQPAVLRALRNHLEALGHAVVAEADSGCRLVELVRLHRPDLVVTDISMGDKSGFAAVAEFWREFQAPVIVVSGCIDTTTFDSAEECLVHAFIPKPVSTATLAATIAIVRRRFLEAQELKREAESSRNRLADRAIVEKAKGVLMKRTGLDEEAAFQKLRGMARSSAQPMGQVARNLLLAEEVICSSSPANAN